LQESASKVLVTVFRNGAPTRMLADELVVGDYVVLTAGDMVPADGVMYSGELQVNQSTLNGEPEPVPKTPAQSTGAGARRGSRSAQQHYKARDTKDMEDPHLLFRGSLVAEGQAVMFVQVVGTNTVFGALYTDLQDKEERDEPLKGTNSVFVFCVLCLFVCLFVCLYTYSHPSFCQ
jgi:P-type E1-E2 ATPase